MQIPKINDAAIKTKNINENKNQCNNWNKIVKINGIKTVLISCILSRCETRVFYGLDKKFSAVVIVGLGEERVSYNEMERQI